jgi:protein pelota
MRVLKKALRGDEGEISLLIESLDDLWHLKHLVEPGDFVFALTQRKVSLSTDKIRPDKMERRTVRLGIAAERIEFHTYSNWLRIHGVIKAGMDEGSYHTLNIEAGSELSIIKRWRPDQQQRIEEAVAESQRPQVILALIEEGEATLGILRQFGVVNAGEIRMGSGKGSGEDTRGVFLREVAGQIKRLAGEQAHVVIAGPGFTKEDLLKVVYSSFPELSGRIVKEDSSSIGVSGFQEVLRRGAVDRIAESSRLAREAKLIEELFAEIARGGRAAYGRKEVEFAANYGAIETLMTVDEMARRPEVEALIRDVMAGRGKSIIFSSEFEPGERLAALGGVAALLRFKVSPEGPG